MRLVTAVALTASLTLSGLPAFAQTFEEGVSAADRGDYASALKHFKPLGEQGEADAQYNVGIIYSNGLGVAQDYEEAAKWYLLAAEQGKVDAQLMLGFKYGSGDGVTQNYIEAAEWYRRAAEQGHSFAQLMLGLRYYDGDGVSRNLVLAYMLTNLSTAQGQENARNPRELILETLTSEQITEGQRLASEWRVGTPLPTTGDVTTWP